MLTLKFWIGIESYLPRYLQYAMISEGTILITVFEMEISSSGLVRVIYALCHGYDLMPLLIWQMCNVQNQIQYQAAR